jgi:hypothetical protein
MKQKYSLGIISWKLPIYFNFCLILNTHGARDQNIIFLNNLFISVFKIIVSLATVASIGSSKIVNFAHFFVDSQPIRPKFEKRTCHFMFTTFNIYKVIICTNYAHRLSFFISKMAFLAIPQKKPCIKTSKKHPGHES